MKNTKYKINSWVITAVVVIAVLLVNLIVSTVATKVPLKIDLTEEKIYDLSDETKEKVKSLDKEVKLFVLSPENSTDTRVKEYISRYTQLTNKIKVQYIDVYKNQSMLQKYQQEGEKIDYYDIILEYGDKYRIISYSTIKQSLQAIGDSYIETFKLEAKLTNGLMYVTGKVSENNFYFLEGHGELHEDYATNLKNIIESKDNALKTISIANSPIPEDADVIASVIPSVDFSAEECEKLDEFLDNGGKFMVIYTPGIKECPTLESYLKEWGITPDRGIVHEKDENMTGGASYILVPELIEHEITSNIISLKLPVAFITPSMGFGISEKNTQGATVTSLAKTSNNSFITSDMTKEAPEFSEGDRKGPVDLFVLSEKEVTNKNGENKKAIVCAIGNPVLFEVTSEMTGNGANSELAEKTVSYLTNSTDALEISSKIITTGLYTRPTDSEMRFLIYTFVWIIPVVLLLLGIIIWIKRRRM